MMSDSRQNRQTKQKTLILDYLKSHRDSHIRAEEIIDDLKCRNEPVGKATVYRFLKVLESEGMIRKYTLNEKLSACYQYTGDHPECCHHYHLMCSSCGKVIHYKSSLLCEIENEIEKECGFCVDESKTVFYGMCETCQKTGRRAE